MADNLSTEPATASAGIFPGPATQKPQTGLSLFWLLIFLVLTLAGIGAGYFFGYKQGQTTKATELLPSPSSTTFLPIPTPSPAEEWQTYVDPQQRFTFQYPPDWQIVLPADPSGMTALKSPAYEPLTSGSVIFDGEIYFRGGTNPDNKPIEKFFEEANDTSRFWFSQFAHETVTTPLPGVKFPAIKESGTDYTRTDYIFSGEGKTVTFTYMYKTPKVMDTFTKIVASVKLIK